MKVTLTPELRATKKEAYAFHQQCTKDIKEHSGQVPFMLIHFVALRNDDEYLIDFTESKVRQLLESQCNVEYHDDSFCAGRLLKPNFKGILAAEAGSYMQWNRNGSVEIFDSMLMEQGELNVLSFVSKFTHAVLAFKELLEICNLNPLHFSVQCTFVQKNLRFYLEDLEGDFSEQDMPFAPFVIDKQFPTTFMGALAYLKPFFEVLAQSAGFKKLHHKIFTEGFWSKLERVAG